ncbi:Tex family protein [Marinicella sp. W31]|uniref:Tex family protein n=1 Tax=Marinicella sp. W31 TaxID=3023713 RepID=UPI003756AF9A
MSDQHHQRIAEEISAQPHQVAKAVALLDAGDTVPFIARYRKEATDGLDDGQLRQLHERLHYLRELDARRDSIIEAIAEQGKMTAELKQKLLAADTKTRLEDLYLPYKKKRKTKAQIAREAGLEPLLESLIAEPQAQPDSLASAYVDAEKGVDSEDAALEGARQIALENLGDDADLVQKLRDWFWANAHIRSVLVKDKEQEGVKFKDYFEFSEAIGKIPSHRMLALLRGRNAGILNLTIDVPEVEGMHPAIGLLNAHTQWPVEQSEWLRRTVELAWKGKLHVRLSLQLTNLAREQADEAAIHVFARNLKDLLLAAPAGSKVTMGLDPAYRTGVKVVVIDTTGKLLDTAVVYPHKPQSQWEPAKSALLQLIQKHQVALISIGNGTASRETDQLVIELMREHQLKGLQKIMISEAGASVYSASELAAAEFPDLDVSYRGAVSIARRLQDPLAELVKIDPKAIGVGQYQHDVNQLQLARALTDVVEDCVNAVGVDVNTASASLLKYVAGVSDSVAEEIVRHRDENGAFASRQQLLKVKRLGEKMFEQCAGFLRIQGGNQPLDQSAVHPEAYGLVERILQHLGCSINEVIGQSEKVKHLRADGFVDAQFGEATIVDVINELKKPGRDPRGEFKTAVFKDDVHKLSDLKPGMRLEGVVTNVTAFGAFVDIGVHQDGLVHISELADKFVKDPADVVKAGQVLKVRVLEVDVDRKRISLSAKSGQQPVNENQARQNKPNKQKPNNRHTHNRKNQKPAFSGNGALAEAFKKAQKK